MNEEAAALEHIRARLAADSTMQTLVTSVWLRSVPQSQAFPVIKIDRLEANDLYVVGLKRVWDDMAFLVRGIVQWQGSGQPDWTGVRAIGDRIDTLLQKYEGSDSAVLVHSFREESFTDETIESGDLFLHCGGIYRVRATGL